MSRSLMTSLWRSATMSSKSAVLAEACVLSTGVLVLPSSRVSSPTRTTTRTLPLWSALCASTTRCGEQTVR